MYVLKWKNRESLFTFKLNIQGTSKFDVTKDFATGNVDLG